MFHADDMIAGIDMVDLAGHAARHVGEQVHSGMAHVFDGHIAPQRRVAFVPSQDIAEAADAGGGRRVRMKYLLDTNAVIALLRNNPPRVRQRLRLVVSGGASIAISSVVLYELWYGVARSERRRENAQRLRIFLSGDIAVVPFDEDDARTAGELRAALEAAGTPIGPYDLLIAAQALRGERMLVTANVSEFARVGGLVWEDWTAEA